jgi:hypothetical protein
MTAGPLLGKAHQVELLKASTINGVELGAGIYKLEINGDNEAELYRDGELLLKAKVEVKPLGGSIPNSVRQMADGTIKEIRLKNERVVFADSAPTN